MLDALAKLDFIDRVEGLARSIRVSRGLRHNRRARLVGVKRIEWPRAVATGAEIETYLAKFGIPISNRGFTGDEATGSLWCDVSCPQWRWAAGLVADYCAGKPRRAWRDGPAQVQRAAQRVASARQQAQR